MFSTSMTDAGTTSMQSSMSDDIVDVTATSKSELHAAPEEQGKQKLLEHNTCPLFDDHIVIPTQSFTQACVGCESPFV